MKRILVWDAPVRLFHALLVTGFVAAFALAEFTDDEGPLFVVHMVLGLLVGLMTVLRILWGFMGSRYARFVAFEFRPRALLDYARGLFGAVTPQTSMGHNPATSYAVLFMLAAALGLAATGFIMASGGGDAFEEVHELLAFGLLAIAVVHVLGVLWHSLRHRDGIVLAMIDGKKLGAQEAAISSSRPVAALTGLGVTALAATWLLAGYDANLGRVTLPGAGLSIGGESEAQEQPQRDGPAKLIGDRHHRERRHGDDRDGERHHDEEGEDDD